MTILLEPRFHSRKSPCASLTAHIRLMGMSKIKAASHVGVLEMHSAANFQAMIRNHQVMSAPTGSSKDSFVL